MKQSKLEIFTAFSVVFVLLAMMILTGFSIIDKKIINKENISSDIKVDFEKLYPFETSEKQTIKKESIIERYENIVEKLKNGFESYTSEQLMGYEKFIESSYFYNDLMLYKLVSNSNGQDRVDLGNGYLSQIKKERNVEKCVNNLEEFNTFLKQNNTDLLYIQAPCKIPENQLMPSNIYKDFKNKNVNKFLDQIDGKINYIDLRENIKQNNLNHLEMFYKTDHHWLPETGLWATGEISKYLNEAYNLNMDIENVKPDKYNIKVYPRMFLGSDGRYVSLKNAEPEDFDLITPNFETRLNVKILDKEIDKTDTFENTIIDWSKIKYGNYYSLNQYAAYSYGDRPLIEIHNELEKNNKKILLIKDSFSDVVFPFLALENEYMSIIDLRYFNGSVKNYIKNSNPDIVLIMYNGATIIDLDSKDEKDNLIEMWDFN